MEQSEQELTQKEAALMLVIGDIVEKRWQQDEEFGEENYNLIEWMALITNEHFKAYQFANAFHFRKEATLEEWRAKMVELGATVAQAIECLDRQLLANSGEAA